VQYSRFKICWYATNYNLGDHRQWYKYKCKGLIYFSKSLAGWDMKVLVQTRRKRIMSVSLGTVGLV
jgi:hypothetical protein